MQPSSQWTWLTRRIEWLALEPSTIRHKWPTVRGRCCDRALIPIACPRPRCPLPISPQPLRLRPPLLPTIHRLSRPYRLKVPISLPLSAHDAPTQPYGPAPSYGPYQPDYGIYPPLPGEDPPYDASQDPRLRRCLLPLHALCLIVPLGTPLWPLIPTERRCVSTRSVANLFRLVPNAQPLSRRTLALPVIMIRRVPRLHRRFRLVCSYAPA